MLGGKIPLKKHCKYANNFKYKVLCRLLRETDRKIEAQTDGQ